ncbi:MarR family transcriptional regulator [Rhodoferax lacus]|uniref:MarR family transcriptional regulator n=1 Tax=Rhodoferax lacus TaxID=2184758 RepID=A0A3E1RDA1_9BURK|nr:MarR family winged helix-turn-helix transcriptional regulator [Rhodoferax lacus]RFO97339.1 MarR family transcriptional regulator [Rhodoferax lacus]
MTSKSNPGTEALAKADFEALAEFRYRLRLFLRFSEDACNAQGITPLQYQLLLQTKGFPGRQWASITELAERLQAKHHGVVALVTRCEALGLVQRRASASDSRQVEIHLTAKGEKQLLKLARLHRDELATLPDFVAMPVLAPLQSAH